MLIWKRRDPSHDWRGKTPTIAGALMAFASGAEPFLASGCVEGAVFADVIQHITSTQQGD